MKYLILLLFSVTVFSCKSGTDNTTTTVSDTTYRDSKGKEYKFLAQVPDSLRTPDQEKLVKAIQEVTVNFISVKNNQMVFELTKEQFLAKGIPERYYHMLQQNILDNNVYFNSNGIRNVDQMIKDTKKKYNLAMEKQRK